MGMALLTSSKAEAGDTDACHPAADNVHAKWLQSGVDVVPHEAGANIYCLSFRIIIYLRETEHRNLDASRRREALIGSVAAPLDREGRLR